MRCFLRNTRRGWMIFNEADKGGGAGGGGATLTIEQQLEKALTDAHAAQQLFEKRDGELKSAQEQVTKLTGQFEAATKEATDSKADAKRLTDELATASSERETARNERDTANKNVERLESLCGLKGIDPKAAVTVPAGDSPEGGSPIVSQYLDLKKKEDSGDAPHGSASKFYRKNKKEIDDATGN